MEFQEIRALTEAVRGEVRKAVVGQDQIIDCSDCLLIGGILVEGVPGTAKTMIAQHRQPHPIGRIQFTPV